MIVEAWPRDMTRDTQSSPSERQAHLLIAAQILASIERALPKVRFWTQSSPIDRKRQTQPPNAAKAHDNRNAITPATMVNVPSTRLWVNFSFNNHAPNKAANKTEVSRSAATVATGACVMAHKAMP